MSQAAFSSRCPTSKVLLAGVFILSRVREAVDRGMSTDVRHGVKSTAGVVTSAALVVVAVSGSFALGFDQLAKRIGIGLAAATRNDATIIRAVRLPATMTLLATRNWSLPKKLSWLPAFARTGGGARNMILPSACRHMHVLDSARRSTTRTTTASDSDIS